MIDLLTTFEQAPSEVDEACKLAVYPNLQLSSLFVDVPSSIKASYKEIIS